MNKNNFITEVMFRKVKGEVIAMFPYEKYDAFNVLSYMHIGQHSSCHRNFVYMSKPATESEYASLKNELEQIGYNLKIIKRINYEKM